MLVFPEPGAPVSTNLFIAKQFYMALSKTFPQTNLARSIKLDRRLG
jgi:hypothetical protein